MQSEPMMTDEEAAIAFACVDCGVDTNKTNEYYMVHDFIWKDAALMESNGGMLCIGCLEERIGFELSAMCFTAAPVNHGCFEQSERLKERVSRCSIPVAFP